MIKSKFRPAIIDLTGESKIRVHPHKLVSLLEKRKHEVKRVVFNPPKLGGNTFGKFVVTWKNKRYGRITHVK